MQLETQVNTATDAPTEIQQGLLFVLSAPSGTGKDSVINALKQDGMDFYVVASVTTRAPRPGESDGNPYYFVSLEEFERMVAADELLEHANVHGNWYGQPIKQIKNELRQGRDVLLKIDVQGAATVRQKLPGAIFIFLTPGSVEELAERLINRSTETPQELERRLDDARGELAQRGQYDYIIENRQGKLMEAVEAVRAVMQAEHCKTHPRYVDL
ncbi:guanylate kinase [Tengunoibacter tsumagoiensis]|uniref:Guanylate kinase n=1 Tax=Tengunoibacter tsumagoiensis TaxID=2014871 RepID=A0A402A214_9CHLR|nr:guanylate kinase [Tengunoibacter tsumagoiensis]GCE13089.1 guanylate kinase [Tengunoibacter tsumagoiensis]